MGAPNSPVGVLLLQDYPPLPYEVSPTGTVLSIGNFPPHAIRRLESWEWEISNENVTFVSCFDSIPDYSDRGSQSTEGGTMLEQLLTHEQAMAEVEMEGHAQPSAADRLYRFYRMLQRLVRGRGERTTDQENEDGD